MQFPVSMCNRQRNYSFSFCTFGFLQTTAYWPSYKALCIHGTLKHLCAPLQTCQLTKGKPATPFRFLMIRSQDEYMPHPLLLGKITSSNVRAKEKERAQRKAEEKQKRDYSNISLWPRASLRSLKTEASFYKSHKQI